MSIPRVSHVLVGALSLAIVGGLIGPAIAAEVPTITKEELRAKLGDPSVVVVDVRQPSHWRASDVKIKGAVRENPGDTADWAGKYPKHKTLVLYCA